MFNRKAKNLELALEVQESRSFWQDVGRRFIRNNKTIIGLVMLAIIVLMCLYGMIFLDYETQVINQDIPNKLQTPSLAHLFGTDDLGRDIFNRIVYGARYSLFIGFSATIISLSVGSILGCIAGYFGGKTDNIIMRLTDVFIAIPSTLMAIAVVSALGPNFANLIIAIALGDIPGYARIIRSSVLSIRDNEFVEASVAVGGSSIHIMAQHIFPNTLAALIVQATLGVGYVIIAASGLSYLGLGVMPPAPEWGAMLSEAQAQIRYFPHQVIFPGIAIVVTVLALNLLGDALRDAIDPTLKD
ncbi:ABC transporter permease [Anaerovoracaceae bacterium 41-7]|jgi:peptide/nickel transport system permease protein|uniref:ABC transporter permease n=1 Tax=Anaerotruncus colihominis TaxID=169435 RepID=A0A845QKM8_9FIRM|nr:MULTISPECIES: ABC transporter permease [Clostridia]MCI9476379.1 ABC transporter permease [Emergencia sp.]MCI9640066.1 ABC transporter permease [Emergencia sp.]NBH60648.1 ABC transporter permease [Anaerotruncus colihominis]NCE99320.1 ABC transporter permease [Emergencia sp. 1XD21-10]NCF01302.1 ABC transporter permease [Anaerotruncus sp. 80]